jgi:hypothetical protein
MRRAKLARGETAGRCRALGEKLPITGGTLPADGFLPGKHPNRREPFYAGAPGNNVKVRKYLAGRQYP